MYAILTIAVHCIVYGTLVVLLEYIYMYYVLAYKKFFAHLYNLVFSILVEQDYIVHVRAVGDKLILLERCTNETLGTVNVQFLVCLYNLCRNNCVEVTYLGLSWIACAILLLEHGEPFYCHCSHLRQLLVNVGNIPFQACDKLLGLLLVETKNARHFYLHKTQQVVACYLAYEILLVWLQTAVDVCKCAIHVGCLFKLPVLVYALLDENALK